MSKIVVGAPSAAGKKNARAEMGSSEAAAGDERMQENVKFSNQKVIWTRIVMATFGVLAVA